MWVYKHKPTKKIIKISVLARAHDRVKGVYFLFIIINKNKGDELPLLFEQCVNANQPH